MFEMSNDSMVRTSSPSNPVISIGPILAVPGMTEALQSAAAPVVAVSPIVGGHALKGPAAQMLATLGNEVSALGVARLYADVIDGLVIDGRDVAGGAVLEGGTDGVRELALPPAHTAGLSHPARSRTAAGAAASPAGGEHKTIPGLIQIADSLAGPGVANDRSHRNFNDEVLAATPMTIASHSVLAATGLALFVIAEIQQGCELCIRNRDDIATGSAIATVGSAAANELLPMKANATAPALAATIGTGNIAGVATAIVSGGPGALFWIWVYGFVAMAIKFGEAVLGVTFRETRAGTVLSVATTAARQAEVTHAATFRRFRLAL